MAVDSIAFTHFALLEQGVASPLCGDWFGNPRWTRRKSAVTCPICRKRLVNEPVGPAAVRAFASRRLA